MEERQIKRIGAYISELRLQLNSTVYIGIHLTKRRKELSF